MSMAIAAWAIAACVALGPGTAWAQAPQWVTDSRTGCRVLNYYPAANDGATWDGPCLDGMADGQGKLQWYRGLEARTFYVGEMRKGQRDGRGATTFADGRYEGGYRDDKQNGQGSYRSNDGWSYVGNFVNDKRHGHGVYTFRQGSVYEGNWVEGNRTGHGVMKFFDGALYEGQWLNNRPNGRGNYRGSDGQTYNGQWANGCFREGERRAWVGTSREACKF
jgi:hypothetical protein